VSAVLKTCQFVISELNIPLYHIIITGLSLSLCVCLFVSVFCYKFLLILSR